MPIPPGIEWPGYTSGPSGASAASRPPTHVWRSPPGGILEYATVACASTSAPPERGSHAGPDPYHALHRSRMPLGVLRDPGPARDRLALRRPARLAARDDRPHGECAAVRRPRLHAASRRP